MKTALLFLFPLIAAAQITTFPPTSSSGGGSPTGPAGGDLSGTYPNPSVSPLSLLKGGWTNWVDPRQCDAVHAYCAAGVITTTTGSITTGTPTLTVASATGWTVGMGIGVAGAGAAGVELFTSVTAIVGTTFTLANNASTTATTQIVNHDDTAAILAAIASGFNVHLAKGGYNVHAASGANIFTISAPLMWWGDGSSSILWVRSINNQVIAVGYQNDSHDVKNGAVISDFGIIQAAGFTSTTGAAFDVRAATGGSYVTNLHIDRMSIQNACNALIVGDGAISNWFTDNYIQTSTCGANGGGIWVDSIQPSGDWHFDNNEMSGLNTGIYITKADTSEFTGNKITGGQVNLHPTCGSNCIINLRFIDNAIEAIGGSPTFGFQADGGAGNEVNNIQVEGGGIGGFIGGLELTSSNYDIVHGVNFYNIGGPAISLHTAIATITGNNIKSNGGARAIYINTSSTATITGNIVQNGPTSAIEADATANRLTIGNNIQSPPNLFGAGTVVAYSDYWRGTTGSIGGALTVGACDSGTATVAGAATGMVASASPVTYPGDGYVYQAYVSAADTVTVKLCGLIIGTPTSSVYNVSVSAN